MWKGEESMVKVLLEVHEEAWDGEDDDRGERSIRWWLVIRQ